MKEERWEKGLELEDALLESADPDKRTEFERLRQYDSPVSFLDESEHTPRRQFRRVREQIEHAFLVKLEKAELIAFGYDTRAPADAKPTIVAPDRWRVLTPKFQNSSAEGSGLSLAGIRVFQSRAALNSHLHEVDSFHTGMPGRTTAKHKIVAEFERRAKSGEALGSLAAESRALSQWLLRVHPDAPPTTSRTIENQIREAHHRHFRRDTTK